MVERLPKGWHTVTPRLIVHDPAKLVRFLEDAFEATGEYAENAPSLMRIGDSIVMVSGAGPRKPMPAFLYLYVDDVDATYRRSLEAGAVSHEEPQPTPYGDRRAMVTDPCGNDWQIATYLPPARDGSQEGARRG
jgi:PhnB protein